MQNRYALLKYQQKSQEVTISVHPVYVRYNCYDRSWQLTHNGMRCRMRQQIWEQPLWSYSKHASLHTRATLLTFPSVTASPTWLTKMSAIADIGIVRVSDNAAANDDVKKQPLASDQQMQHQTVQLVCHLQLQLSMLLNSLTVHMWFSTSQK